KKPNNNILEKKLKEIEKYKKVSASVIDKHFDTYDTNKIKNYFDRLNNFEMDLNIKLKSNPYNKKKIILSMLNKYDLKYVKLYAIYNDSSKSYINNLDSFHIFYH